MNKNKKYYIGLKKNFGKKYIQSYVKSFSEITGDKNPIHLDNEFAKNTIFKGRIGHGMWCGGLISAAIAQKLPGSGSVYKSQSLNFLRPIRINDYLTVELCVLDINIKNKLFSIQTVIKNQNNLKVIDGEAKVILPNLNLEDVA